MCVFFFCSKNNHVIADNLCPSVLIVAYLLLYFLFLNTYVVLPNTMFFNVFCFTLKLNVGITFQVCPSNISQLLAHLQHIPSVFGIYEEVLLVFFQVTVKNLRLLPF